ncbi:hypothetical protein RHSP_39340 [Rhizobium freirei PRF 81]|uniref:Uncharacterized protein n=1 Tax=Rhizobium freirei PRF 81 TaxID=363754 RepID=N6V2R5_9HYPH|nr:hypothetical protein RHSP_39340 [Rhizobium freirei PRF 81]
MTFAQLFGRIARHAVDHAATLDGGTRVDQIGPALDILVILHLQEFAGTILPALGETAVPGPDGDIGDRVFAARDIFAFRQATIEHVEFTLHFHRKAIDRIFDLRRCISIEVPETAAEIGRAAHLPEQPGQAFGTSRLLLRQEGGELFGEIGQDRSRFKNADRLGAAAIEQGGDLRIRVNLDEAAAELVAVTDLDQPGVIFGAAMTKRQQLLEQDRDLHAIRRAERIELKRMAADRQFLFMRRPGDRTVDIGELAAIRLVPGPDLRRRVFGRTVHKHRPFGVNQFWSDLRCNALRLWHIVAPVHFCERRRAAFRMLLAETKKACRGRRCGRLSSINEQWTGGGEPLFAQTTLGGGEGRPQSEGMREEMHRFDGLNISVFCSVDRHFFARQLCAMRKAENSTGAFFGREHGELTSEQNKSACSGGSRR